MERNPSSSRTHQTVTRDGKSPNDGAIVIVVEKLRLLGYAGFWVVVVTGVVLTKLFSKIDVHDTLLTEVFGYNNICVYFDSPPSTYILPLLWAITLVFLLAYLAAHWLQMKAEVQEGNMDPQLYRILTRMKVFEAFTMVGFSTIFAVKPEGWDHTLVIHTTPFFLLQIGMISLALSNTLHGINGGYWRRLGLPEWFNRGAIVYCVLFGLVVCFKIPVATNAMAGSPWWKQTETFKVVAVSFDRAFLLFAAVLPMVKSAYLLYAKSDKLEVVRIATSTTRLATS
jgi:hypothetical protein